MKCLSLWQPWASLIAYGVKRIETRHWSTAYRGPLAIHAAQRRNPRQEREAFDAIVEAAGPGNTSGIGVLRHHLNGLPRSAIVATVTLRRIERTEPLSLSLDRTELACGNYEPGRFGWVLSDIWPIAEPIPYRGRQGLFDVPDALFALPRPVPPRAHADILFE